MTNRPKLTHKLIDQTHFDNAKKVQSALKSIDESYDYTIEEIQAKLDKRPLKKHPHKKKNYYVPLFSKYPYAYMIDLLQQSNDKPKDYPAYYFIAININTKYIYVYPQDTKEAKDCITNMKKLIKDTNGNIVSLTCDEEAGFKAVTFVNLLTKNNISIRYVDDQRHSALSTIDTVIKTLRDMNTPGVRDTKQSDDKSYRDFSIPKMKELVKLYNNTYHYSIDMSPKDMQEDTNKERSYIIKKLYAAEGRKKLIDYELEEGEYVRYITTKDALKKHRYKVSPEAYKISHKDGHAYVLMANDGTTKKVQRWRLFKLGKSLPKKYRIGESFHNNEGTVKKLLSQDGNSYEALYEFPNQPDKVYKTHKNALRGITPQIESIAEREFRKKAAMRNSLH